MADQPACNLHDEIVAFSHPLTHFRDSLNRQRKTRVVAIGSSSTAGVGDVLPFPPRLELLLRQEPSYYGRMIDVVNRGIGGQESPEELSRFEADVLAEEPALVIWQVGTNAVFRLESYSSDAVEGAIAAGLKWLSGMPVDVVLMDQQYTHALVSAPAKLARSEDIVKRIGNVAADAKVNLFKRWELMKTWHTIDRIALKDLDDGGGDHLHTSAWATICVAKALSHAIVSAPAV